MNKPLQISVTSTEWYSMPALVLETPTVRIITVPGLGAKIVSLFDRVSGHEWLMPPTKGDLQPIDYGAPFTQQDMSGWDEMFPTIDRCEYPVPGKHQGAALPDHGEVWSLSWTHDTQFTDGIRLSVEGVALPYRLTRTIQIVGDRVIRLSYEAVNLSDEPLAALWTAHPQFTVDAATLMELPDEVSQLLSVQATPEFPTIEAVARWPETTTALGSPLQIDRVRLDEVGKYRKFYLPPEQRITWAAIRQPLADGEKRASLHLSWDAEQIPYLGVWADERAFSPVPTVALEPSTGFYDNLSVAWDNQRVMQLLPDVPYKWSIDLTFAAD